jgi:serine phosphatase RsbU (regulator of sigma subunit)
LDRYEWKKTLTLPTVAETNLGTETQIIDTCGTPEIAHPPGTILLVDDSPLALDTVSTFLEELGWTVHCVQTSQQALTYVHETHYDLVVSDLNLPGMNGIELFRTIRRVDALLPVVILSDERTVSQILESMHAGIFDFVPKSDFERLLPGAIIRAVTHGRLLRDNQRLSTDLHRTNESLEQRLREQAQQIEIRLRQEADLEREAWLAPLRREVEIAQRIQTSILPNRVDVPGLEIATQMMTASEVSGDYYDIRSVPGGCWIGIGDVAGHGLEAGLVMLMIQSGLASLILHDPEAQPHELLPALNHMLYDNLRGRMGRDDHATITMLRFYQDGRLLYAGAHEEILICNRQGQIRSITTHGTWVGIQQDIQHDLESRTIQLDDADLVILYTDGIPEARHHHECFGMPRFLALIRQLYTLPVREILNQVCDVVKDFCEGTLEDDATLIVFRYRAPL